jgi:gas vesicle protein
MKLCYLIAFAGGALVGGAAMWMLTSKEGEELRKGLMNRFDEAKRQLARQMNVCEDCCTTQEKNT